MTTVMGKDIDEHHIDHCIMTCHGRNFMIARVSGNLIMLENEVGALVVDVADVRWDEYHEAWRWMMRERFGGDW